MPFFSISNDYTIKCKQGFSKTLKHSKSKPSFRPSHSKGNINSAKAHYNVIIYDLALLVTYWNTVCLNTLCPNCNE